MDNIEIMRLMRLNGYSKSEQYSEAAGSGDYLREDLDKKALEKIEKEFQNKTPLEISRIWQNFGSHRGEVMRRMSRAISRRHGGITETLQSELEYLEKLKLDD